METKIIHSELSYKIMGAVFEVGKKLPVGLPEKDYQKALALLLTERGIPFKREVYIPIIFNGKVLSKYFADFVVDEQILLELKISAMLGYAQARQVLTYLRSTPYRLGILIYFTKNGVQYRRIVNDKFQN